MKLEAKVNKIVNSICCTPTELHAMQALCCELNFEYISLTQIDI